MNILYVSPEIVPFAKTGGLADVAGALPKHLAELGHEVALMMPLYRAVREGSQPLIDTGKSVSVPVDGQIVAGHLFQSHLPGSKVKVYLLDNPAYYDRDGLYVLPGTNRDYRDNCERFVFFARGVLEAAEVLGIQPDIIHANDWQAGLIPVYLKTLYAQNRAVSGARTLFTIHNLAYQGTFRQAEMELTGLDWSLFNWHQLEFYGKLNCLKGGLVFADVLSTVSRRYAEEIQSEEFGCGLEGVLMERSKDLFGVVNGVDYSEWNPANDPLIPAPYGPGDLSGKAACKAALLKKMGLPTEGDAPLVGIISRLAKQKGFDILQDAMDDLMALDLKMVVLGTGDEAYQEFLKAATLKYPRKLAVRLSFSNELAHQIEAGSDMFLMPSHYEPCGLNQLYSMKYGTVPVVRAAGGLADTVVDYSRGANLATGFVFDDYTGDALLEVVRRAVAGYADRAAWSALVANGMAQDWSWGRSAAEYVALYEKARSKPFQIG
jgi:starch synthase